MNANTDDLVRWLGEQLDEDERIVREANTSPEMVTGIPGSYAAAPVALLIAEFAGPARVLREIDAKRQILALHEPHQQPARGRDVDDRSTWMTCCSMCQASMVQEGDWPCDSLRLLALPYADRPGFRAEWRP